MAPCSARQTIAQQKSKIGVAEDGVMVGIEYVLDRRRRECLHQPGSMWGGDQGVMSGSQYGDRACNLRREPR